MKPKPNDARRRELLEELVRSLEAENARLRAEVALLRERCQSLDMDNLVKERAISVLESRLAQMIAGVTVPGERGTNQGHG